jgi:hypothetical protein
LKNETKKPRILKKEDDDYEIEGKRSSYNDNDSFGEE